MVSTALAGIRCVDLSIVAAGPYCSLLMAALGAQVIKVESCGRPDPARGSRQLAPSGGRASLGLLYPDKEPGARWWNRYGLYNQRNRGKLGVTLDLTKPRGVEILKNLVRISDVVLENFRGGVMKRLGLDYEVLREVKPDLIMLSLSSQGATGPESGYGSYGVTLDQTAGLASLTGYPDGLPVVCSLNLLDTLGPLLGLGAILAALRHRRLTGQGQYIDFSQREMATSLLPSALMDYVMNGRLQKPLGNRHPYLAPHGCYRCRGEERWVVIAVSSDEEWKVFCRAIGEPAWTKEPRFADMLSRWQNQDDLDRLIEEWTSQHKPYEVMHCLQAAGVAAGLVLDGETLLAEPHLAERGWFDMVTHPEAGTHPYVGYPMRLSQSPVVRGIPAPCLGEHNGQVLGEILGMSASEIADLEKEGIIGTEPLEKR